MGCAWCARCRRVDHLAPDCLDDMTTLRTLERLAETLPRNGKPSTWRTLSAFQRISRAFTPKKRMREIT
jgi:hypothetical protein